MLKKELTPKQKKIARIFIVILIIFITFVLIVGITGMMRKETSLKDTYVDLATKNSDAFYIESYLMMDCCDEWDDMVDYVDALDATDIEGYEYYVNDYSGNHYDMGLFDSGNKITIHMTDEFKEAVDDAGEGGTYKLYSFNTRKEIPCEEDGDDIIAKTKEQGIFILTYKVDGKDLEFISNEANCTGQCRNCA